MFVSMLQIACRALTWLVEGRGQLFGYQSGDAGLAVGSLGGLVSRI